MRRLHLLCALLAIVSVTSSCGSKSETPDQPAPATATASDPADVDKDGGNDDGTDGGTDGGKDDGAEDGTDGGKDDGTGNGKGDAVVGWIRYFGPLGGHGSTHEAAYRALSEARCDDALALAEIKGTEDESVEPLSAPFKALYRGAAAACLAALQGRHDLWGRATDDLAEAARSTGRFDCGDRQVLRMLRSLVRHHQAGQTEFRRGQGRSVCARVEEVRPNHGPAAGNYAVKLVGQNFPRAKFRVYWCDLEIVATPLGRGSARITVPPRPDDCERAIVDVTGNIGVPVRPVAGFQYDEPELERRGPSQSPDPAPSEIP